MIFATAFYWMWASQVVLVEKNTPANAGDSRDMGWTPGSGRSPGVGNDTPFQYSFWKIPRAEEPDYNPQGLKESDRIEHFTECPHSKLVL